MIEISNTQDLGTAIRAERKRLGFSQEQLAAAAGVGPRFVVELEGGKPTARFEHVLAVAHAVGFTITASASGAHGD